MERIKDLMLSFLENSSKVSSSIQIIHESIRQPPGERNQRHKWFKDSQHLLHAIHKLWLAAYFGLPDIITVMLEKGVDILTKTGYGETALHPAARCGNETAIELLLRAGADINALTLSLEMKMPWESCKPHYLTEAKAAEVVLMTGKFRAVERQQL